MSIKTPSHYVEMVDNEMEYDGGGLPWWGWTIVGLSIAAVTVGAGFGINALVRRSANNAARAAYQSTMTGDVYSACEGRAAVGLSEETYNSIQAAKNNYAHQPMMDNGTYDPDYFAEIFKPPKHPLH